MKEVRVGWRLLEAVTMPSDPPSVGPDLDVLTALKTLGEEAYIQVVAPRMFTSSKWAPWWVGAPPG